LLNIIFASGAVPTTHASVNVLLFDVSTAVGIWSPVWAGQMKQNIVLKPTIYNMFTACMGLAQASL
jgi:hypothetical protein